MPHVACTEVDGYTWKILLPYGKISDLELGVMS